MQEVQYFNGNELETDTTYSRADEMREEFADRMRELRNESGGQIASVRRRMVKIGRNDPCPCGSGKKFKKCCL